MSSHEHLWKKGFIKPNSTPVQNPFKIQRRHVKALPPPLSQKEKLQLKQQAEQISQLGYNSQKIPIKAPAPTVAANPIQSKPGEITNQKPTTDAVEIQADVSDVQDETKKPEDLAFGEASDASAADSSIQRQEIPDSEAEAIPESDTDSIDNPEEEADIQAKAEQPSRNFLELPVNAPGTSPSSIQRQVNFRGLGNSIQQQPVENEEKVEPEVEQEAQESDETIQRQIPEAEEDEISSSESQTVQRQSEPSDTPAQQTEKSEEYHNFLEIPVNVPGTPSSSIPRQVNFGRLSNQVIQPIKPTPNPGLNRLNTFKSQRIESPTKPVNPVLNQSPAQKVQRQDNTEDEEHIQNQPLQESGEETVQTKTQSQPSDATATSSFKQSIQRKSGSGQSPQQENESEQDQQELDTLKPKSLSDKSPEFSSDKQQLSLQQGQVKPESLEAKKLEDNPLQLTSIKEQQIPQTQVDSEAAKENQPPETKTKEQPQQKVETPVESQAETGTGGSMGNAPTPPTAMTPQSQDAGLGGGTGGKGAASAPQEAVTITAEDPAQIIEQLKNTPPTQAVAAYAQAEAASVPALEKQKQNVQETIPEIPAPTGLPAQGTEATQTAEKAATKAAQSKGEPKVEVKAEGSAQPEAKYDTQVPEAPPAPPPAPTQLAGGNVQEEGQNDEALSRRAQQALSSVQMNTSQITTSAGERPNVDLNGEANPAQIQSTQTQSNQEVQIAKAQAVADTNQDFGENSIFPKASNETLKVNKELSAIAPPTIQGLEAPALPGEATGGLNQSLTPFLREKIGTEQEKYQAGKDKFDTDTAQARADADQEIAGLDEQTKQKQIAEQEQAKAEITQARQEWRTELDTVDQDYQEKASQASQEKRDKIDTEKLKGEEKAAQHLEDAEKEAEQEKQKADKDANKKKEEGEKESGGFWGWVKSKAKAFIDGIKQAVNFIYDNLRKAVKAIFDAAKKLATAAIDLARQAIVGLIKGFGEILKGLVKVAFAAFPEIAKKINAKIDQAVKKAEKAVNAAADLLKKGISAVLDFLANTLDSLLGLIQDIYNGALTVIGMIINGEFAELFKRIGNLVEAAKTAPAQFETAALEELLGGNLDQPLSPQELSQAAAMGISLSNQQGESTAQGGEASELPSPPWTTQNVGVDGVENNMELSPELVTQLMEQTNGDGEVMLGESNDESRSLEAIMGEATGQKQEGGEPAPETIPDDGLAPKQRAEIKWEMMKQGISQWWSDNWPIVLGAGVLGVAGFIAANIVTGGAITAALPTIMAVVAPLFAGVTIAQIGGHIRDYLAKGWEGEIQPGGKSLAKGLAAGAIELVSWLTFKVGGAALKGAKAAAKGAKALAKGGIQVAKKITQAVIKGAKYLIQKGKVLFKGIAGSGIGKQFKRLQDLGQGLLKKMRFKAFRIRVKNRRFKLEGLINPWIVLATGNIVEVDASDIPSGTDLGDEITTSVGKKGKFIGDDVPDIVQGLPGSSLTKGKNFKQHFIRHKDLLENVLNKQYPKYKTHADEFVNDLSGMISSGRMKYTGLSTLQKGGDYLMVYRGEGLTAVFKRNGEWVTLLETGKGMDLQLDSFMIATP
ncbi:MAG: hypothetical protein RID09_15645 [Coleofasciculus sp. G1-WW12-02]|uniref:hypothetical protein n=1 Tax=Coleofasciculus sp. G1-WW12-02 TaxID=3068483 RepID=UPI003301B3F9